jgi:hypothetical protein
MCAKYTSICSEEMNGCGQVPKKVGREVGIHEVGVNLPTWHLRVSLLIQDTSPHHSMGYGQSGLCDTRTFIEGFMVTLTRRQV